MLADQGFPADTQNIYEGLEKLSEPQSPEELKWLHDHASQDYLLRNESARLAPDNENKALFLNYQALVFGFYYRLFEPLLSFKLVEEGAFFHGIWGSGSTTFLAICTQFSRSLRRPEGVSRAHVL